MRFPILPDSPSPTDGQTLVYDDVSKRWVPATASGGGSGTSDHAALTNRDAADQHPIGAVTGLQSALDGKADATHTHGAADLSGVVKTVNGEAPDEAGNVDVAGGGGGTTPKTRLIGRWHGPLISGGASDGAVMGAGILWCSPSWSSGETYDAIWHRSAIQDAAGTLRLGIYAVGSDGLPSTLLWGSPALSGATGGNRVVTFDEPLVIPAGPYLAVAVTDSATLKAYIFKGAALDRNWVGATNPDNTPSAGITIPNYDAAAPLPAVATTQGWSPVSQPVAVTVRRSA